MCKVNKPDVCYFGKQKTSRKVEMESNKDGFISDSDYKGIAETSVTLFEAVNL